MQWWSNVTWLPLFFYNFPNIYILVFMYVYILYIYIYMYAYMYIYSYIYIILVPATLPGYYFVTYASSDALRL